MGKAQGLRCHLQQFKKQGVLNTKKVKWQDLEQVQESLAQLLTELIHEGHVILVITDTGCSQTCWGYKKDFVPGSLTKLDELIPMDGVAGSLFATHTGLLKIELLNDEGGITRELPLPCLSLGCNTDS